MTYAAGWQQAAADLGLTFSDPPRPDNSTEMIGEILGFSIRVRHDGDAVGVPPMSIAVGLPEGPTAPPFTVHRYVRPREWVPGFHKRAITSDPNFNIRFTIAVEPEHRDAALAFLSGRRRRALIMVQVFVPSVLFRVGPDGSRLTSRHQEKLNSRQIARAVRAMVHAAAILSDPTVNRPG